MGIYLDQVQCFGKRKTKNFLHFPRVKIFSDCDAGSDLVETQKFQEIVNNIQCFRSMKHSFDSPFITVTFNAIKNQLTHDQRAYADTRNEKLND